jgi:hypothetical protein
METKIIPTAEELWKQSYDENDKVFAFGAFQVMIEFTKLHVKAAIKEYIESAPSGSSTDTVSYEDVENALKDCYSLENIK